MFQERGRTILAINTHVLANHSNTTKEAAGSTPPNGRGWHDRFGAMVAWQEKDGALSGDRCISVCIGLDITLVGVGS